MGFALFDDISSYCVCVVASTRFLNNNACGSSGVGSRDSCCNKRLCFNSCNLCRFVLIIVDDQNGKLTLGDLVVVVGPL